MKFEGKQIKKVDGANKTTIAFFFVLARALIVLLLSYVHMKTSV